MTQRPVPRRNRVGAFERRQTVNDDIATSWSYTYDPLGRLIRERRTINEDYGTEPNTFAENRDVGYQYDRDSNRTEVIDHRDVTQSESYSYVANTQRLDRVTYYTGKYKQYYWTANGELAREDYYETTLKSSQIYTWGIGGTLVEVRFEGGDQDGCKVNYEYDSDNELIGRTVTLKNGNVTESERYLVDHQNPTGYSQRLAVLDTITGAIRHEIFTDELAAETTVNAGSANTQYVHSDALGSVRSLTGASSSGETLGTDAEKHFFDYTAFGSPLRGDRSLTNYAFTGQYQDTTFKAQYHRARWLSVYHSSWYSSDSIFDFPNNFGNAYSYAGCSPVVAYDLTGNNFTMAETVVGLNIAVEIAYMMHFKIGNLPFGLRVEYLNVDTSIADTFFQLLYVVASFLPGIGDVMDIFDFKNACVTAWEVIVNKNSSYSTFDIAFAFLQIAVMLIAVIVPFLSVKLVRKVFEWIHMKRAARLGRKIDPHAISASMEFCQTRAKEIEKLKDAATGAKGVRRLEALGMARFERQMGRKIQISKDVAFDFLDSKLGKVSLKGPIMENAMHPDRVSGFTQSIRESIETSDGYDTLAIDVCGLTTDQVAALKKEVQNMTNRRNVSIHWIELEW